MNVLVTGGTGGLGRATVERFASDANNEVYFTYGHSRAKAEEMEHSHKNVHAIKCDFTDMAEVESLTSDIPSLDLDVLVNNAWCTKPVGIQFLKVALKDIESSFTHNVLPTIAITQAAVACFRKKKFGRIITVITSSVCGTPVLGYGVYSSTKAYMLQMARTWSKELIRYGISSNCVSPEFMKTDFTSDTDERIIEQMEASHPLKRLLQPEEVAAVIASLAYSSPQVNGVNIPVNAGTNI